MKQTIIKCSTAAKLPHRIEIVMVCTVVAVRKAGYCRVGERLRDQVEFRNVQMIKGVVAAMGN